MFSQRNKGRYIYFFFHSCTDSCFEFILKTTMDVKRRVRRRNIHSTSILFHAIPFSSTVLGKNNFTVEWSTERSEGLFLLIEILRKRLHSVPQGSPRNQAVYMQLFWLIKTKMKTILLKSVQQFSCIMVCMIVPLRINYFLLFHSVFQILNKI